MNSTQKRKAETVLARIKRHISNGVALNDHAAEVLAAHTEYVKTGKGEWMSKAIKGKQQLVAEKMLEDDGVEKGPESKPIPQVSPEKREEIRKEGREATSKSVAKRIAKQSQRSRLNRLAEDAYATPDERSERQKADQAEWKASLERKAANKARDDASTRHLAEQAKRAYRGS